MGLFQGLSLVNNHQSWAVFDTLVTAHITRAKAVLDSVFGGKTCLRLIVTVKILFHTLFILHTFTYCSFGHIWTHPIVSGLHLFQWFYMTVLLTDLLHCPVQGEKSLYHQTAEHILGHFVCEWLISSPTTLADEQPLFWGHVVIHKA